MATIRYEGQADGRGVRIGVVVSRFNSVVTNRLLAGAMDMLRHCGVQEEDLAVAEVPGVFEIPVAAKAMAGSRRYDAVICLGAVIKGETPQYAYLSAEATRGIGQVALETSVPVLYGVVTAEDTAQALERAGGRCGHRGREAAHAALEMVTLLKAIEKGER